MRKIVASFLIWLALAGAALAQSSPGLVFGQVPTAAQWNSYFAAKQNVLGYTPVNRAGDVMTGKLVTAATTTLLSGFNLAPGTAPITPTDGDLWTTTTGIFVRINGATVGPLTSAATPCTLCALTNVANVFTALQTINLNALALPAALTGATLNVGGVDATTARIQISAFGAQSFYTVAAYGGTNAIPTAITSGTQIGGFNAYAYNGSSLVGPIASFRIYAAQNIASGNQGSRACIGTTPIASTTIGDSLCQYANGFVNISSTASTSIPDALLTINANTAASVAPLFTASLHLVGANGLAGGGLFDSYGNQNLFYGRRANNTQVSLQTLNANDAILTFAGVGYNGTAYTSSGNFAIIMSAANTWSLTDFSTYIDIRTTPIGSTTLGAAGSGLRVNPSGGVSVGDSTDPTNGVLRALNGFIIGAAAKTLTLKEGANGSTGTFVCTGGGTITITNSFVAITDKITISLNTVGGTITTVPAMKAITGGSFQVLCGATDTSTYNYGIIKSAARLLDHDLNPSGAANDNAIPVWFERRQAA